MKKKKPFFIAAAVVVALGLVAVSYLWATRVPQVDRDPEAFWKQKEIAEIPLDPELSRMVTRAKLDFILFPTEVGSRKLNFASAYQSKTILYLTFRPVGSSHTAIVYAYNVPDRKPLWKAQIAMD